MRENSDAKLLQFSWIDVDYVFITIMNVVPGVGVSSSLWPSPGI